MPSKSALQRIYCVVEIGTEHFRKHAARRAAATRIRSGTGVRKKLFRAPKCGDWLVGLHAFITSLIHETAGKRSCAQYFPEKTFQAQRSDESLADATKFGCLAPLPRASDEFFPE
jgi:hypothetical protein